MRRACLPLGFSLPARPRGTAADATLRWLDFTSPDEAQEFELATDAQFAPGTDTVEKRTYKVSFGQIYLSKPMMTEADGETETMFPHEARLRNLTCVPPCLLGWAPVCTVC